MSAIETLLMGMLEKALPRMLEQAMGQIPPELVGQFKDAVSKVQGVDGKLDIIIRQNETILINMQGGYSASEKMLMSRHMGDGEQPSMDGFETLIALAEGYDRNNGNNPIGGTVIRIDDITGGSGANRISGGNRSTSG